MKDRDILTKLVHSGQTLVTEANEVVEPIYLSATFRQKGFSDLSGYGYARSNNPTREALEHLMEALEGAQRSFGFASGMAAIHAVFSLFQTGDKILILGDVYGGTYDVLNNIFEKYGIKYEVLTETGIEKIEKAITEKVGAIYFETPSNPTLTVHDISKISRLAKAHHILTIVDNTFMSPYLLRPLALGVDIVIESATKYLGGHSDLIGGVVSVRNRELEEKIKEIQAHGGGIMQPFDAYLLIRSIKTLGVRLNQQTASAEKIAVFLSNHEAVAGVHYPGLPTDKGYEIQMRQAKNGGGMISFEMNENYDMEKFFDSLQLLIVGGSLGSVETLISHPVSTSHDNVPDKWKQALGITDRLIRISVGLEAADDIIADIEQAFKAARIH